MILTLQEYIKETTKDAFLPILDALEVRQNTLSHQLTVAEDLVDKEESKRIEDIKNKDLSIDNILADLFKIALGAFEKPELDHLNSETLRLFEGTYNVIT